MTAKITQLPLPASDDSEIPVELPTLEQAANLVARQRLIDRLRRTPRIVDIRDHGAHKGMANREVKPI